VKITRFEELECWREARNLAKKIYDVTRNSVFKRDFRLSAQIQAAGASVMANIAEGFIRRSDKEFTQFLFIAMSSAAEVQSHLYVALDQGYMDRARFDEIYRQAEKTAMIISGLIKYLRVSAAKSMKGTKLTRSTKGAE